MSQFSLEIAKEVGPTKIPVFMLCIDGQNVIQNAIEKIQSEGSYEKEIPGLFSIINQTCNLKHLPDTKFKQLKLYSGLGKVYEAKSKNLRMYLTHIEKTGRAVILLGKKTNQKKDLNQLKSLLSLLEGQDHLPLN